MPVRRRLAAALAILTVPTMVAVAAIALFGDPSGLIIAHVLLALAAGAVWIAATRRGVVRWVAMTAVAACLVGIALALTLGTGGIIALVLMGLLLAGFGIAARYTLGAPPRPGRRVATARHGVLIVSGGKAERFHLVEEAERRAIHAIELTSGFDLRAEGAALPTRPAS